MTARLPPFAPSIGSILDPATEVGIVEAEPVLREAGGARIPMLRAARDATIRTAMLGVQKLDTRRVEITAIETGIDHVTLGHCDGAGTDRNGLGGVPVMNTTAFALRLTTGNLALKLFGIASLPARCVHLGTDGTLALVETEIRFPASLRALVGNEGVVVLNAVIGVKPFIHTRTPFRLDRLFDLEGALLPDP